MRKTDLALENAACAVVENLEERRMLSAVVAMRASVLTVDGTRRSDTIIVTRTSTGRYDVDVNGHHSSVRAKNVSRIVINGGRGDDDISISNDNRGVGVAREIHGGFGNDTIVGGKGTDDVFGDAGDDRIDGRQGDDSLNGGADDDTVVGGVGDDSVAGDDGDDDVDGSDGHDHVDGGAGHDHFHGGHDDAGERDDDSGADDVGDDSVAGGGGADDGVGHHVVEDKAALTFSRFEAAGKFAR